MESKPPAEAGPPVLIESVVRLLLPPATREHVLGDLAERYSTPSGYAGEALRTLPFVIVSQIRRTSQFPLWPLIGLVLFGGFASGRNTYWVYGVIPTIVAMIGFMLRDAYKIRDPQHPWRQGFADVSVAAAFVAASQALLALVRPDWVLGAPGVLGGTIALGLLFLLRVQNPSRSPHCVPVPDVQGMTLAQLHEEASGYGTVMRRSARIELAACCVLLPLFTTFAIVGKPPGARLGALLTVAGGLFVAWRMWRAIKANAPIAADADFVTTAAIYRERLERQQQALRTIWLWYLLPVGIGPILVLCAAALRATRPDVALIGTALAFGVMSVSIVWPARRHARRMQDRINALQRVEEAR
jgi:hypothetical protein